MPKPEDKQSISYPVKTDNLDLGEVTTVSFPKGKMLLATRITALARIWAWEAGLPPLAGTLYVQGGSREELAKAAEVMRAL